MTKFLGEHVYSHAEKHQQLCDFIASLQHVLNDTEFHLHYPEAVANHRDCLQCAQSLLDNDFTQDDLSQLSRALMPVLWSHKEWTPPLERTNDGSWRTPVWYPTFEALYDHLMEAKECLRIVSELKYSP